jgi:dihydroorotate dehydrogenase electron transfer subunit
MREYQENSIVQSIEPFTDSIFRLTLHAPLIAQAAQPGQFVMVNCGPSLDPLLRRPFSIHQTGESGTLQLLIKVIGRGTKLLSEMAPGATLSLIGPLGRGFRYQGAAPVCLIGGGIGIAPLLFLARRIRSQSPPPDSCFVLLGGRTGAEIQPLVMAFDELGCVVNTATDDGSLGHTGLVGDLLPPYLDQVKKVYVCGPHPMMASVARMCMDATVPCEASLEATMACGLGACLGCTIHGADGHYKHVCKHGPVFNAEEVAWTC